MNENLKAAREEEVRIIKAYQQVFRGPNGETVIKDLRRRWMDRPIIASTTEQTMANAAYHDVVQTIINFAEANITDE